MGVVTGLAALTLALVVWAIVAPSRTGVPGLMAIFLPYALVVALGSAVVAPLARRRQALVLVLLAATTAILVAPRVTGLMPGQARATTPIAAPDLPSVRLVTYNTYVFDDSPPERLIASLVAEAPAIVALQEVSPERGAALDEDPDIRRLFPHRLLRVTGAFGGLSLLSSYPIEVAPSIEGVSLIEVTAQVAGRRLAVLAAHALPPLALAPFPFQPGPRDTMLVVFRERMLARTVAGEPVVLMGDLNTTDREVAFDDLAAGYVDLHASIGSGPGHTWGLPPWPVRLPPLLRIDHMLLSTDLVPLDTDVECGASDSDHCLLRGIVGLPA